MLWKLAARQPFSLQSVIKSHGWIQLRPFQLLPSEAGFSYVYRLASGRVVHLKIEETEAGIAVDPGGEINPTERDEISEIITWMLGLDQDFSAFYELIAGESSLANASNQSKGRVLRCSSLFEDTVKTILTTNTVWGSTIRMVERLVQGYGSQLDIDPSLQAFPTPEQIANSRPEELRSVIRLGYRAPYIHELGCRVAQGDLDLENWKHNSLDTSELYKRLLEIKGVGKYAAANLLMLLGRYDQIPIDSWALKVVSHEWYGGEPIGAKEVMTAFERFGEWKGLAFWLWDWKLMENQ